MQFAHDVHSLFSYDRHTNYQLFPLLLFLMFTKFVPCEVRSENLSFSLQQVFRGSKFEVQNINKCIFIHLFFF